MLWAALLLGATWTGPWAVAVVAAPVAAIAAASTLRRSEPGPRVVLVALGGSAVTVLAAGGGWTPAAAALVAAVAGLYLLGARGWQAGLALAWPAAAGASLVLADHGSIGTGLSLAAAACLFDLGNYAMGTGSYGGVLGAVSGAASVGVMGLLAAAVIAPPFSGHAPWIMFGLVAALAPAGVVVGAWMAGGRFLPALRRLDALLLAGPAWVVVSHIVLR